TPATYTGGITQLANADLFVRFSDYLQGIYSRDVTALLQSSDEMKKRLLVFNLFDVLLVLLRKYQDNFALQSQLLLFYGQYAAQYTAEMSKVPIYVLGASNTAHVDTQDLSKFTMGYDNISIRDAIDNVISHASLPQAQQYNVAFQTPGFTFEYSQGTQAYIDSNGNLSQAITEFWKTGKIVFKPPTYNASGVLVTDGSIVWTFTNSDRTDPNIAGLLTQHDNIVHTVPQPVNFPTSPTATQLDKINAYQAAFQALYSSTIANDIQSNPDLGFPATTWPNNYTTADPAKNEQLGGARQAKNQQMQQLLEAARSKRETISDIRDQTQSNFEAAGSAMKGQLDVFSATVRSLSTILSSIFKS
ncbi:MAG TPA: hypothetical protein VN457_07570, partial [Chlamydiales bacterium]|nr:hypothetical protein [Chlamydiales bacterium]